MDRSTMGWVVTTPSPVYPTCTPSPVYPLTYVPHPHYSCPHPTLLKITTLIRTSLFTPPIFLYPSSTTPTYYTPHFFIILDTPHPLVLLCLLPYYEPRKYPLPSQQSATPWFTHYPTRPFSFITPTPYPPRASAFLVGNAGSGTEQVRDE